MKMLMFVCLILALTTSLVVATETNSPTQDLTQYLLQDAQKHSSNVVDESVPWAKFSLTRPKAKVAVESTIEPPMLAVAPSARLQTATASYTNIFQSLNGLSSLLNFNSVFTKVKGDSTLHPSMALQVILLDFAVMNKYDVDIGPSYLLVDGKNCVQLGMTIKFLETPGLQKAVQNTPLRIIPVNLGGFYLYIGAGCRTDKYQEWDASIGLGVQTGN